jgi:hypothetical protein
MPSDGARAVEARAALRWPEGAIAAVLADAGRRDE